MGSNLCYFIILCAVFLTATDAQLSNSSLCTIVVPSFDCALDRPKEICATNGVTYPTRCDFSKAHCANLSILIDKEGPCDCEPKVPDPICAELVNSTCQLASFPVCASDGTTYQNLCSYQVAKCVSPKLKLISLGLCSTEPPTTTQSVFDLICQGLETIACSTSLPEVCGSDGLTYPSACELEKANCKSDATITLVKDSSC